MEEGIQRIKDRNNLTDVEKKHVPIIEAPDIVTSEESFEVKVTIGGEPHVMEMEHYIEWVEVWFADNKIGKYELGAENPTPEAIFNIIPSEDLISSTEYVVCNIHGVNLCSKCGLKEVRTELKAIASCNVHGLWESAKEVNVVSKRK
ncbi:class II SORL domain-containing protein [Methanococcoides sp. AM1]|uniref:class II SORL domain-containing protein n=1 Tax=Methanococcoides sp. AM1 TaxID=1201011 RepID=UPI001083FC10|nr:class II SORL domain-containing protein [Methanococcoides sp. AM1]